MSLHFWGTHMPDRVSEAWRFERLTALTRLPSRGISETLALAEKVHIGRFSPGRSMNLLDSHSTLWRCYRERTKRAASQVFTAWAARLWS
jgi:hypothetical protein